MRKIYMVCMSVLLLIFSCSLARTESISRSGPETSRFIMQLDSDLNFKVTMEYSDVAGGVAESTIFIMIAFQQGEVYVAYDVFPLKITGSQGKEVLENGKGHGELEFSVVLSKYTDVERYDDILEIRMFLVDALGRKSKAKSLKFDVDRKNRPKAYRLFI